MNKMETLYKSKTKALINFMKEEEQGFKDFIGDHFFVVSEEDKIVFLFSFKEQNGIIEIYDVFTRRDKRNKGLASKHIGNFIKGREKYVIWLGIVDRARLNMYFRLGFTESELTYRSPLGNAFPFYFVGLYYQEKRNAGDLERANELFSLREVAENMTCENFSIKLQDYEQIYSKVLSESCEIGGSFSNSDGVLSIAKKVKGDSSWTLHLPCSEYLFHTHPQKAYTHHKYTSGLPSSIDYIHGIKCGAKISVIFAVEGIYTIRYNPFLIKLLKIIQKRNPSDYKKYLDNFGKLLQVYEKFRAAVNVDKLNRIVLEYVNSLEMNSYDYEIDGISMNMFSLSFVPHENVVEIAHLKTFKI